VLDTERLGVTGRQVEVDGITADTAGVAVVSDACPDLGGAPNPGPAGAAFTAGHCYRLGLGPGFLPRPRSLRSGLPPGFGFPPMEMHPLSAALSPRPVALANHQAAAYSRPSRIGYCCRFVAVVPLAA
jgi:hypothetical protein